MRNFNITWTQCVISMTYIGIPEFSQCCPLKDPSAILNCCQESLNEALNRHAKKKWNINGFWYVSTIILHCHPCTSSTNLHTVFTSKNWDPLWLFQVGVRKYLDQSKFFVQWWCHISWGPQNEPLSLKFPWSFEYRSQGFWKCMNFWKDRAGSCHKFRGPSK